MNLDRKILFTILIFLALVTLFIHQENGRANLEGEKTLLQEEIGELEDAILEEEYWRSLNFRTPFTPPLVNGVVSSKTGFRVNPMGGEEETLHRGYDIVAPLGTPVKAALPGVVVEHYPPPDGYYRGDPIYGGKVTIDCGRELLLLYGHLGKTIVHEGDWVEAGDVIGYLGNTGKSTGPHLHFEVVVSPARFFEGEK